MEISYDDTVVMAGGALSFPGWTFEPLGTNVSAEVIQTTGGSSTPTIILGGSPTQNT